MTTNLEVLAKAATQTGKRYLWGAKPCAEVDPAAFDCSGLLGWTACQLGLPALVGGTWGVKAACAHAGSLIPVSEALTTPGALLGMDYSTEQHVAYSDGRGRTMEARGVAYGVGSWAATGRPWNWAARQPGVAYQGSTTAPGPPVVVAHLSAPVVGPPVVSRDGYRLVGGDGGVFAFDESFLGGMGGQHLNAPVVGGHGRAGGYRLVGADGGVFCYGDLGYHGSAGSLHLNAPIVAITGDEAGYRLYGADGGVFAYGDLGYHGSAGSLHLNAPIVAAAPTPPGGGYWLAGADGGVFAFGDAGYFGSMAGRPLNRPVVGITPTLTGRGYWLAAADGGIFAFGDAAGFADPLPSLRLAAPVVGVACSWAGAGLVLSGADGGVFCFGDAGYHGSVPETLT